MRNVLPFRLAGGPVGFLDATHGFTSYCRLATSIPRLPTTALWKCHRRSSWATNKRKWIDTLESFVPSDDVSTMISNVVAYQERRRQRKPLKILYVLGFIFTFPVGPLLFLAIRHRGTILQDLRLSPTTSSSRSAFRNGDRSETTDETILRHEVAQVDAALQTSKQAWQEIRDGVTFDQDLLYKMDRQVEELMEKAVQALLDDDDTQTQESKGSIERGYLLECKALREQKSTLRQKLEKEQHQLRTLEDKVRTFRNAIMVRKSERVRRRCSWIGNGMKVGPVDWYIAICRELS